MTEFQGNRDAYHPQFDQGNAQRKPILNKLRMTVENIILIPLILSQLQ